MLRRGRRWNGRHLELRFRPSREPHARLGLVVPKHGRKIVERNRLRRRLRELGRRELLPRLRSEGLALDVLIRTRPRAYGASYGELSAEVAQATEYLCSRGPQSD